MLWAVFSIQAAYLFAQEQGSYDSKSGKNVQRKKRNLMTVQDDVTMTMLDQRSHNAQGPGSKHQTC